MKKSLLLLLIANSLWLTAFSQYWQQKVNYKIDVALNDKEHTVNGIETIEYFNQSPDTLHFIWFHLWPNAYKNDKTAFTDQTLENGNTKFYFSDREEKGFINRLDFKVNNVTARLEDHPQHIDIAKLVLPNPLPPGKMITITTPFNVRLPKNFSRGGHVGQSYQVTQWYPKPAVYDKNGWHPMTYLDQGEYYSEFGSFDVSITVPANYVVAATGELQDPKELEWLKGRSNFDWTSKKGPNEFPATSTEIKILRYKQDNVHDFAWFADKRYIVNTDTCRLGSGKTIQVFTYYLPENKKEWANSVSYAKDAVRFYSREVGEYPYNVVSAVGAPLGFNGGMEYPTITSIEPNQDAKTLDLVITHEIGHNWFAMILGSNERVHPWMDEGLNTYYEEKYHRQKYGSHVSVERLLFETKAANHRDQPIETPSDNFEEINYYVSIYHKTASWLRYLESRIGSDTFQLAMKEYYRRWQFKHPQPGDLRKLLEEFSGRSLENEFSLHHQTGLLPNQQKKGTRALFALSPGSIKQHLINPDKNLILFGPALGFNSYDKFMAGGFITNMALPSTRFQFFAAPLYATGTRSLNGIGSVSYRFFPKKTFHQVWIGLDYSTFTKDEFVDKYNREHFTNFEKFVPGIQLVLKEKDPRSNRFRYLQFKSYLVHETNLRFFQQTTPIDTLIISTQPNNYVINQLKLVFENNRALYPFRGELRIEQGKDFLRPVFIGNYFFNYPKEGGLSVQLFAGKFFYTTPKTINKQFETDRFHLNLTGANGYEDYLYNDYFIGRNKFQRWSSQQIMIRDGAFKVRTDLLAEKVGKTDDWMVAANFTTIIPSAINPLAMLPVKIPLKIFADIGTNAPAWTQDSEEDRFLFDAGVQVSLFAESINIYIPLLYSRVYRDYFRSTLPKKGRLWREVSFSIDISNLNPRKLSQKFLY